MLCNGGDSNLDFLKKFIKIHHARHPGQITIFYFYKFTYNLNMWDIIIEKSGCRYKLVNNYLILFIF